MSELTSTERRSAARALSEWFKSQDIGPGDAVLIMVELMAICFVDKTTDLVALQETIDIFKQGLALNIVRELKAKVQ